jgi:hypothetical protein
VFKQGHCKIVSAGRRRTTTSCAGAPRRTAGPRPDSLPPEVACLEAARPEGSRAPSRLASCRGVPPCDAVRGCRLRAGGKEGTGRLKTPPAARRALAYPHLALVAGRAPGRPGPSRPPVPVRTAVASLGPPAALPQPRHATPPLAPTQANRAARCIRRPEACRGWQPAGDSLPPTTPTKRTIATPRPLPYPPPAGMAAGPPLPALRTTLQRRSFQGPDCNWQLK